MKFTTIWDPAFPLPMRERITRTREWATIKIAWRLPHQLTMWCAIRVGAHATTGQFGTQIVPDLLFTDALKRWDDPRGGDPTPPPAVVTHRRQDDE